MDTLDLIRQIETDPGLRAQLRSILLGDEVLGLPAQVAELVKTVAELVETVKRHEDTLTRLEKTVAELVETVKRHEDTLTRLEKTVAELVETVKRHEDTLTRLEKTVAELVETVKRHEDTLTRLEKTVAELVETVKRHEDTLTRLEKTVAELVEAQKNTDRIVAELVEAQKNTDKKVDRLGGLWGGHFETKWREDGTSYLGSQGFRRVRLVSKDALDDLLDEADDAVHDDIRLADAVHSAIRKDTGVQVYVVTEVSSRIHKDDVERALRRAALLHEQLDTECLAAVAGASIDDTAESLATEANAMVVMPGEWQRLTA